MDNFEKKLFEKLLAEKIKPITDTEIGKSLSEIFDEVTTVLKTTFLQMTLDELADCYSKKIDKLILIQEKYNDLKYIGGEFKVYYLQDKYFGTSFSLYFQDRDKQWKKTYAKSNPQNMKYLKPEAIQALISKKTVVFEIEHPHIDNSNDINDLL